MTESYNIDSDFTLGVNEYQLKNEILSNTGISINCLDVGRVDNIINIVFESAISVEEKTILDSIVSNHVPIPIPINASMYVSNNVIKSDISDATFTFLGNQPNEVHISKTSQTHYPSIKAALTARNEENIVFIVHPGVYIEDNPLTLPNGCCLLAQANAENTSIVAQNSANDILNIGIRCKIQGFTFVGAAAPGSRGLYFDGTQSGGLNRFSAIFESFIVGCNIGLEINGGNLEGTDTLYLREVLIVSTSYSLSKGIYCHSGGQIITSSLNIAGNPFFSIEEGTRCEGDNSKISMTTSAIWFCDKALYIDNNGEIEMQLLTCKYNNIALYMGNNGMPKINGNLFNTISSNLYDIDINSEYAIIDIQSGVLDILKIRNPYNVKINARFQSSQFGSYFQNFLGDIVFGTKKNPAKLAIGEGTYDVGGIQIFTNTNGENGTWTDNTFAAVSMESPPLNIFPGTESGNCLYIGRDDNPVGVKIYVTTSTSSYTSQEDTVWEYWNGTNWIEFNVSQTTTQPPYYHDGANFISHIGKYQIRFGITTATPLVAKILNGENKKWVRLRLVNNISNIPIAEYCKLHVNSKEVNADGFTEYYGDSRPVTSLNIWRNGGENTNNIFLSSTFSLKTFTFLYGNFSQISMNGYIPADADVGFPIKIKISLVGDNDNSGIVNLIARYTTTNISSTIFLSSSAPSAAVNEKSISINIPITASSQEFRGVFDIDISKFLINPSNKEADLLWLSIERDTTNNINDTYVGNISVVNIDTKYIKMYSGAHLLNY